jgi:hypothetical protein
MIGVDETQFFNLGRVANGKALDYDEQLKSRVRLLPSPVVKRFLFWLSAFDGS